MPSERGNDPSTNLSGTDSFAHIASGRAIRNLVDGQDDNLENPDNISQKETEVEVIPEDFDSFNLDAVDKLEDTKNKNNDEE